MSADPRRTTRLVALITVLAVPATAASYNLTGASWHWQDHAFEDPIRLDTGDWPSDAGSVTEIEDNIVDAMDEWNDAGIDLELPYGGRIADGVRELDGYWDITYSVADGSSFGAALAYAATWFWSDYTANDCDIVFLSNNNYGDLYWASDADDASSSRYHIEAVALHELGHCVGLDHSASSSAVMYAYYGGLTALTTDDINGAIAVHGATACVDGDGDGFSDCDLDCDDSNAAVNPGAGETCNGADDDCDGVVDLHEPLDISFNTGTSATFSDDWYALGNAFTVDAATMLIRAEQAASMDPGLRLVWSVYSSSDGGASWDLERSERGVSTAAATQTSPDLYLPLTVGLVYAVQLGAMGEGLDMDYTGAGSLSSAGPLTPLGMTYARALGDQAAIDTDYLVEQTLTVTDEADPDGDGETALCGDCAPADPAISSGAAEVCNGIDDNCDGVVDEGFESDVDGDGVIDCLDPCPDDVSDDSDGDGACDSDDPCPADVGDDSDGDGACDSDDPCPDDINNDSDGDGSCDSDDPCPDDINDDSDGDGSCDSDDPCPSDPEDTCGDDGSDDGGDDGSEGSGDGSGDDGSPPTEDSGSVGGSLYVPGDKTDPICSAVATSASVWLVLAGVLGLARRRA